MKLKRVINICTNHVTMLLDHLEEVIPYICIGALKNVYIAKLLL